MACEACNPSSFIDNYDYKCYKCSASCIDCMFSSTYCIGGTCLAGTGRTFINNKCLCDTLSGFFDDGKNEICQKCSPVCLTCINLRNKCLACNTTIPNRLDQASANSLCPCKPHYYDSPYDGFSCLECHYSCGNCLGYFDICESC